MIAWERDKKREAAVHQMRDKAPLPSVTPPHPPGDGTEPQNPGGLGPELGSLAWVILGSGCFGKGPSLRAVSLLRTSPVASAKPCSPDSNRGQCQEPRPGTRPCAWPHAPKPGLQGGFRKAPGMGCQAVGAAVLWMIGCGPGGPVALRARPRA